jgi:hypothetical protein
MHDYRKSKVSVNGSVGHPASPATRRRTTPTTSPAWPAPAGRVQCGREQRGHPRRLTYSKHFSQWVALVNNIPTLASRLNGLSITDVAASSHSYDLNRRRYAVRRSPAWPAGRRQKKYESSPRARRWPPPSPTPPGHRRAASRPFSLCVARCPTWWHTAARTSTDR